MNKEFDLKIAANQNEEAVTKNVVGGDFVPTYSSEVTTTTYQIGDSLSTTLNLKVIVPLELFPQNEYIEAILKAWNAFQYELASIGEFYTKVTNEEDCFDDEDNWNDEAEFDSYEWFHHFDDADWEE